MMTASGLTVGYRHGGRGRTLLAGCHLTLAAGRLTALLGANGRGKSTLLRTLAGLQPPLSGTVTVDGRDVYAMSPIRLARLVTIVTGAAPTAGAFTVDELVDTGRQPYTGFFGRLSAADRRVVSDAIAMTGISHLYDRHVATLSDGERQRAMIAKALAQQTPVIILDEPTAFLDVANRLELLTLLSSLAHDEAKSILLSTHDVAATLSVADDLWLMVPSTASSRAESELICGPADRLIADGELQRLFPDRPVTFDPTRRDFIPANS